MSKREIIANSVKDILIAIGEDPNREGLKETPLRVAKMFEEIFASVTLSNTELIEQLSKTFTEAEVDDTEKFGDMVIVKDIPFYSSCEHHLVTIIGRAHIGYIPKDKIIGLSKIARLVDMISKRPQLQERIGKDTMNCMVEMLDPIGVMVVIEGRHMCMESRGVKKSGAVTVTSATYGAFSKDDKTRNEFINLIQLGRNL